MTPSCPIEQATYIAKRYPSTACNPRNLYGLALCLVVLMFAALASAQTTVTPATTTTQFAGKVPNAAAPGDVTVPQSGIILNGSATNPATGRPFRHFWYGDTANGFCRLDPDVDTPGIHTINQSTCTGFVNAVQFKPGEAAFDPSNNNIYTTDIQAGSVGVFRMHFLPTSDSGHGLVDPINIEVLVGSGSNTKQDPGGCPMPGNPTLSGSPQPKVPDSASLGPDGNLWVSFKLAGALVRVNNPSQPVPTTPEGCANFVQVVGTTPDNKKNFGLAWIDHDLYGGDGFSTWVMHNADTNCLAPQTGNVLCTGANGPSNILSTQTPSPFATQTDQAFPGLNGNNIYVANASGVIWIGNVNNTQGTAGLTIATQYGGTGFSFISGLTVDATNPAAEVLYVGDDPSNGFSTGTGRWWTVTHAPPPPAPPGVPTNVRAVAGDASATVTWSPAQDGQPVTSYVVHASFVSNGTTVPDTTVTAPAGSSIVPNSVTITGLTNGVSYAFEVKACNAQGCSAFSAPSNTVTPKAITVPDPPTNVQATPADSAADVVWTDPANNGGTPITSYTVTARVNGVATGTPTTVNGANATAAHITGLTNGTTYTFTVHATNAKGNSAESAPSPAVTPSVQGSPDLSLTMSSPASVNANSFVTFTITVKNVGTAPAANVVVTDTLPSNGTFQSDTTTQGICSLSGLTLTCTLGGMSGGATATITVVDQIGSTAITNSAKGVLKDANGNVIADPTPGDEQASSTTTITVPQTTTDVQVTGSAQNGGPAVGSSDTYTWQIKNSGNQAANGLQFNLPLPTTLNFETVSTNLGTCTGPAPGTAGSDIVCNLNSLAAGTTQIVTVNVIVNTAGSISTTGTATFGGTDTNTANNSFTVVISAK